jgi:hypothetical protein
MKTLFGIGLIIFGIITFFRYLTTYGTPNFYELIGATIGIGLITFLPGILLIRSDNKDKSKTDEK